MGQLLQRCRKPVWAEVKTATHRAWVATLWPVAHSLLQLRQHREHIFSHYRKQEVPKEVAGSAETTPTHVLAFVLPKQWSMLGS